MKLEEYHKLQEEFENGTFEKDNKKIYQYLFWGSFLPNIVLVILGFAFLFDKIKAIPEIFNGQFYILCVILFAILCFYELAKREILYNTTKSAVQSKGITFKLFLSIIFALLMVVGSFYLSLNGAQEIVDKREHTQIHIDTTLAIQTSKIDSTYDLQINSIQSKIDYVFSQAKDNDRPLKKAEREDITRWESSIKELSSQKNKAIINSESKLKEFQKKEDIKSNDNQSTFLIISIALELLILFGVGFKPFYQYRSFKDKKKILSRDPNYDKYMLFLNLLNILYQNGKKIKSSELSSIDKFKSLVKSKQIYMTEKEILEFLQLLGSLKVTIIRGKSRTALMDLEDAKITLTEHFGF